MVDTRVNQSTSDPYPEALRVALRYVSFKPRTVAGGADFDRPVVEQVLASPKGYDYLDEAEYAAQWRNSRGSCKPRGSSLIRRYRRGKGVAEPIIDDALVGLDEFDAACRAGPPSSCQASRWDSRPSVGACGTTCTAAAFRPA